MKITNSSTNQDTPVAAIILLVNSFDSKSVFYYRCLRANSGGSPLTSPVPSSRLRSLTALAIKYLDSSYDILQKVINRLFGALSRLSFDQNTLRQVL
jgi:hypothetical protein